MKVKNQLKKDSIISRQELEKFCQDFGYIKLSAPSKEASKKLKISQYNNNKSKRSHKK